MPEARETWPSRQAFILAAVGAAIGFGNVWRFPALAHEYGGGAFFIPYLLALVFLGIPLLLLELALGQHLQMGDVGVFGSINKRLRCVGLIAVMCGFTVSTFYVPLLVWTLRIFFESFGEMSDQWENVSSEEASNYFFNDVVGMETIGDNQLPTRIVYSNIWYLLIAWLCVGLCVAFGVGTTGKIVYFTMGMPIVSLFAFVIRAVTLEGAGVGIQSYIGEWDLTVLTQRPDVWSTAMSQILFSLGLAFGVMTAFGSHCPPQSPAAINAYIIGFSNSFFSIIAGIAVFGSLGYLMEYENAESIEDVVIGGPSLLFGALPAVLSTLPGNVYLIRMFLFTLFLLGIDSAFAMIEAGITVVKDSEFGRNRSTKTITAVLCSLGFLGGIMYMSDAGLTFFQTVNFYVNYVIIMISFCKTFSAGWIYGLENQLSTFGSKIVYAYMLTSFGPLIIACMIWFWTPNNTVVIGFVLWIVLYVIGIIKCAIEIKGLVEHNPNLEFTLNSAVFELVMGNILQLKHTLESSVGGIPTMWPYLVKHFIPQVLIILFFNLTGSRNELGEPMFGHYEAYPFPYQCIGIFLVLLVFLVFLMGLKHPDSFQKIAALQEQPMLNKAKDRVIAVDDVYLEMAPK